MKNQSSDLWGSFQGSHSREFLFPFVQERPEVINKYRFFFLTLPLFGVSFV